MPVNEQLTPIPISFNRGIGVNILFFPLRLLSSATPIIIRIIIDARRRCSVMPVIISFAVMVIGSVILMFCASRNTKSYHQSKNDGKEEIFFHTNIIIVIKYYLKSCHFFTE